MPTYTDQFFRMDPGTPPSRGTMLTVEKHVLGDVDGDGFIGSGTGDTLDGFDVTAVWVDDQITVRLADGSRIRITGTTFYVDEGGTQVAYFTPTDGTILEDAEFLRARAVSTPTQMPVGSLGPPCFTRGVLIGVPGGLRRIEDLRPGDLVTTMDRGARPVIEVLSSTVRAWDLHAPIRIAQGALGNRRALLVSPQHRFLVTGWQAELNYGADEVLVAARHLVDGAAIRPEPVPWITYYHLLFDRHEIVFAEGCATESFHPGDAILSGAPEMRQRVEAALARAGCHDTLHLPTARPIVTRREAALLRAA